MKFTFRINYTVILTLFFLTFAIPYVTVLAGCVKYNKKDIVVGLLSTEFVSYPNEYNTALGITKLLESYGVHVVLMDYNVIMQLVQDEIISINKTYEKSYEISRYDIIKNVVMKFIKENNISRILIPGNHYNISSLPIAPSLNRQLITNAVVSIIHNDNHCIHLFGVCGGLQGIMYANGIRVTRVENIIKSQISVKSHTVSAPNPRNVDANLHQIKILPNNRLSDIAASLDLLAKNQVIYFPDSHSEAIDTDIENIKKIYNLGYKIIAMSEDGIIEGIEDNYGNMYFQFHPEYLMINAEKKRGDNNREASIALADAIIKDFLFRD
ncbi:glutamine amidotransferase-related protein [Ehrlichia canis]|uniref:Uncharacterized protein n=1 Tax=Ehrlichia canis (strain Jake) TaxID=269484 RepID=A0ACA6AW57_EHRCJ|nr:gamma-glutamyl-gamma-aminobutyrate hydrolase family protein [Ehrlichia canis]AAZ68580.1 hypothetical protein Ecaj_0545 [Ehrlichia canis str. Jake]